MTPPKIVGMLSAVLLAGLLTQESAQAQYRSYGSQTYSSGYYSGYNNSLYSVGRTNYRTYNSSGYYRTPVYSGYSTPNYYRVNYYRPYYYSSYSSRYDYRPFRYQPSAAQLYYQPAFSGYHFSTPSSSFTHGTYHYPAFHNGYLPHTQTHHHHYHP